MASQYCFIISDSCGTISDSCGLISNSCGIISCSCGMISLGCGLISFSCGRVYFFGEWGFWLGRVKKNLQSLPTLESGNEDFNFHFHKKPEAFCNVRVKIFLFYSAQS